MIFKSKLPNVGTTIFTVMSSLAAEHKAINLGQGFPDFAMDEGLQQLVTEAMHDGHNQYVHMAGFPPLRKAIAKKIDLLYNVAVDAETEITVTPGATYGIYSAITTLIHAGDEVIVFEPAYDSYMPNVEVNGGKVVALPLEAPSFKIDWQQVSDAISPRTRAIIINSPHNPTGAVLSPADLDELAAVIADKDIWVVSDEVYEHLVFDDKQHVSVLSHPVLRKQSVALFSFGKTFSCTGWKLGYAIAPPAFTAEFRKVHQFNAFTCNSPMQVALAQHMIQPGSYNALSTAMQQKRNLLRQLLQPTGLKLVTSSGSYFECYDYSAVSMLGPDEYAKQLVVEAGVATIPLSAFYRQAPPDLRMLRFCFAKKEETLREAASRMLNWVEQAARPASSAY